MKGQHMSQFQSEKHVFYDDAYFVRLDRFSQTPKYRRELEQVITLLGLREADRVLDIGCNTGNPARYVEEKVGCKVIGIDFPPSVLHFWRDKGRPFAQADAHNLPFPAQSFDHVYILHTIGHVLNPQRVLSEIHRVLKPGGRVALVTPNRWFVWAMRPLNYLRIIKHTPDPTVLRYYTLGGLRHDLERSGFDVVAAFSYGALPNLAAFLRATPLAAVFRERLIAVGEKRRR